MSRGFAQPSRVTRQLQKLDMGFFLCMPAFDVESTTTVATCQPRDSLNWEFFLFKFFENDLDDYDVYPVTTIATDSLTALIVYFFASTFYKPASFPDNGREVFLFCC